CPSLHQNSTDDRDDEPHDQRGPAGSKARISKREDEGLQQHDQSREQHHGTCRDFQHSATGAAGAFLKFAAEQLALGTNQTRELVNQIGHEVWDGPGVSFIGHDVSSRPSGASVIVSFCADCPVATVDATRPRAKPARRDPAMKPSGLSRPKRRTVSSISPDDFPSIERDRVSRPDAACEMSSAAGPAWFFASSSLAAFSAPAKSWMCELVAALALSA